MDIRCKLQEIKELYEKGLISEAVYEDQQKKLLATCCPNNKKGVFPRPVAEHAFLGPKKNFSIVIKLLLFVLIVLGGIWVFYSLSDRQTKESVRQFASQTGIGTQVIPWSDLAETAATKVIEENRQNLANAIQGITHPTGKKPSLANFHISKLDDKIIVELLVSWTGGFIGGRYSTTVTWEIAKNGHEKAKVTSDSAIASVGTKNIEALDDYFRTKVYPAFYSSI